MFKSTLENKWNSRIVFSKILLLLILCFRIDAFATSTADIVYQLVGDQIPEIVAVNGQIPQKSKLRFFKDNIAFGSSVLTVDPALLADSVAVIVKFTGLGGNVESYGN